MVLWSASECGFAQEIQGRLVVAPFAAAAAVATTAPAKRKLMLLAACTAIDAAVAHAATEAKPIDAKVVVEVMHLLTSRDRVRDLHSLRLVCELTMRCSGPRHVSFRCLLRAVELHWEAAVAEARAVEATALLRSAATNGEHDEIRALHAQGANVNATYSMGKTSV
jgi:hypothetical protein